MINGRELALSEALAKANQALNAATDRYGASATAVIGSVGSNLETLAVIHHLCTERKWQGPIVESETRKAQNLATAAQCLESELAVALAAVSVADTVLVIGADPVNEAPMLSLSLRQARRQGGHVALIDPRSVELPFDFDQIAVAPADLSPWLDRLIGLCAADRNASETHQQDQSQPADLSAIDPRLLKLARQLCQSRRVVVVCGTDITTAGEIALAADLVKDLRQSDIEAKLFYPLSGPNALAAGLMMNARTSLQDVLDQIEAGTLKSLVVVENDLWRNYPDRDRLDTALGQLDLFILLGHLASPLCERADVFIPTQTLYESGGHWINQEGRLQEAQPVMATGEPLEITGGQDHPPRVFDDHAPGGQPLAAWRALLILADGEQRTPAGDLEDRLAQAMKGVYPILGLGDGLNVGRRIELGAAQSSATEAVQLHPDASESETRQGIEVLLVDRTFGTEILSAYSPAVMERTLPPRATVHPDLAASLGLDPQQHIRIDTGHAALMVQLEIDASMATGVMVIPRHKMLDWQVLGATRLTLDGDCIRAVAQPDESGGDS